MKRFVLTLGLLSLSAISHAQTYAFFPNDAMINTQISSDIVVIGYDNLTDYNQHLNPTSPHITITTGANIGDLQVFNGSIVNITGGKLGQYADASDNSTLNYYLAVNFALPPQPGTTVVTGFLADGNRIFQSIALSQNAKISVNVVPEPSSLTLLFGIGATGMMLRKRRK